MKQFAVNILKSIIVQLARWTVWRYRPAIVGITGSVGKTSTKLAVASVLSAVQRVRAGKGNLNNELGLSLAILGDWSDRELWLVSRDAPAGKLGFAKSMFWLKVIFVSLARLIIRNAEYPEILVLEYGVDRPGDMKRLLSVARPNVSVVTAVGDVPVHVEFFNGPEDVAREKGRIIEQLPVAGYAVLNYDDETVMNLESRTRAHTMTFGFGKGADIQVTRFENKVEGERPAGVSFKLEYAGSFVPVRIEHAFGNAQGYAAGAAAAVGIIFGENLVHISDALKTYTPARHRMELVPGIKDTYVIDDTYNASPLSMQSALETLKSLPGTRKIAVLGDMLEIGKYSIEAHENLGKLAAKVGDMLIAVGPRAKFIAQSARASGMAKKNIFEFAEAGEAIRPVKDLIKKGDLVLVKGSHAMQLEKLVEELKMF